MSEETYAQRVGQRLQEMRHQKGLSLQDVAKASQGAFKVEVLRRWETGERPPSWPRLSQLARFYRVPPKSLMPR